MSQIFDKTLQALAMSSKMRELRQSVISANVANAETPGYKSKVVDFENALASALKDTSTIDNKMESMKADVYDNPEAEVGLDGNSVDLEKEMASMLENNLMYRTATQMINKKLAALKYAATDGGR
ncbi:MAG: flagellar basal body rod protein FlgB [Bdellovibrionaceae bacterium]|nr:flagellar basal body rod protein FlgB [Pseudobdellovibrionaceae bacterium]